MSSMRGKQRISFGYKHNHHRPNTLKPPPKEFLNYDDQPYIDFSQQTNKKRPREYVK